MNTHSGNDEEEIENLKDKILELEEKLLAKNLLLKVLEKRIISGLKSKIIYLEDQVKEGEENLKNLKKHKDPDKLEFALLLPLPS